MRDLLEVAQTLGLKLEPAGTEYRCRCQHPGHVDNAPSLYLNPDNQKWYCFGCSRGGGVLGLVRWVKPEWDRQQAVELACGDEGEAGVILETLRSAALRLDESPEDGAELFVALMRSYHGRELDCEVVNTLFTPEPLVGLLELVRV